MVHASWLSSPNVQGDPLSAVASHVGRSGIPVVTEMLLAILGEAP